jgi:hypothetical protein
LLPLWPARRRAGRGACPDRGEMSKRTGLTGFTGLGTWPGPRRPRRPPWSAAACCRFGQPAAPQAEGLAPTGERRARGQDSQDSQDGGPGPVPGVHAGRSGVRQPAAALASPPPRRQRGLPRPANPRPSCGPPPADGEAPRRPRGQPRGFAVSRAASRSAARLRGQPRGFAVCRAASRSYRARAALGRRTPYRPARGPSSCLPVCGPAHVATPHRPAGGPGVGRRPYRCHSERSPRSSRSAGRNLVFA